MKISVIQCSVALYKTACGLCLSSEFFTHGSASSVPVCFLFSRWWNFSFCGNCCLVLFLRIHFCLPLNIFLSRNLLFWKCPNVIFLSDKALATGGIVSLMSSQLREPSVWWLGSFFFFFTWAHSSSMAFCVTIYRWAPSVLCLVSSCVKWNFLSLFHGCFWGIKKIETQRI